MNARAGMTGLVVAFILGFTAWQAIGAPHAPASDDARAVEKMRMATAASAEKAIVTQGGSRIVFRVDSGALREAMVTDLRDDVVRIVREDRIPFSGLTMRDGGVELRIADSANQQRLLSKLAPSSEATPSRAATFGTDGLVRLMPTEAGFGERLRQLIMDSIGMIEQGLRSDGITDAGLQPDGADRIRVLLPGVKNPEHVTTMFSKQPKIAFRLVDVSMSASDALQGAVPAASEILYDFKTKAPYLVLNDIAVEGDDIIASVPGFDVATQQPIASFRFNAHGTRRFAHVTESNIGQPFAIVLDDRVLSVSVIREPILGGSGQIAGNFTLEEANTIAMLVRSGALPGRLSVVDRQTVEPAGNAGK